MARADNAANDSAVAAHAPLVRHRPQRGPNALSDYVQQSLDARTPQEPPKSARRRRRTKPRATPPATPGAPHQQLQGAACGFVVSVHNLLDPEELQEDDEFDDILIDLMTDFERFGTVDALDVDRATGVVTLTYAALAHARACVAAKDGQRDGGRELVAVLQSEQPREGDAVDTPNAVVREVPSDRPQTQKQTRKRRSKIKSAVARAVATVAHQVDSVEHGETREFVVRNVVEADEVDDADELAEATHDAVEALSRHGEMTRVAVVGREEDDGVSRQAGDVVVQYADVQAARTAFAALHDTKYGGRTLACKWITAPGSYDATVLVDGILDADELEDDDEFHDVCEEVGAFFDSVLRAPTDFSVARATGQVTLRYESHETAVAAIDALRPKSYGGRRLVVRLHEPDVLATTTALAKSSERIPRVEAPSVHVSETLASLLTVFLQRLASLQERAHIHSPLHDKRSRRLVLGLHEVRRGVQSHKVKLLVLATDFDSCDVLDDRLSEIIAAATHEKIPILRALTRRKLGRILNKHARVSCVGVYSYDGANDYFRDLVQEHTRLEHVSAAL